MKRKIITSATIMVLLLLFVGCSNKGNSINYSDTIDNKLDIQKSSSNITNDNLDIQENNSEKIYDIKQFPEIKKVSDKFIGLLNKNKVTYRNVVYKIGKYTNGEYKNVDIMLNEKEHILMKFTDDGILLVLNLNGGISEPPSIDYENSKLSMLQFSYYNFNKTDITNALSSILKDEDYRIGNYIINGSQFPSFNMFFITDIKNN